MSDAIGPCPDGWPLPDDHDASMRQVVLVKQGQRYVFRYTPGEESKMLDGFADMARDPKCELNWFDAAVLSHQMGQRISQQLDNVLKP